ncbi:MAG: hypothetical protein VYB46_10915 [Pseudomonadota bacterium]|nr:hypothetical protein [Pseudomonadota bacterium]
MATIRGTSGNDRLTGQSGDDHVYGLDGADSFYWRGNLGNDNYYGGDRRDDYDANPYTPGNPGGDHLYLQGDVGARITLTTTENGYALIGDNRLDFNGIERISGTTGNDVVMAGRAAANEERDGVQVHGISIFTGAGNDTVWGSRFDDVIDGGAGNDHLAGGWGSDFFHSSEGNDRIWGDAGEDNIRWGNGDMEHNPGHDTINGGAGRDLINLWIKRGDVWDDNEEVGIDGLTVKITSVNSQGSFTGHARTDIGGDASVRFTNFELGWTHQGNDVLDASDATVSANGIGVDFNTRWGHDRLIGSVGNDTLDGSEGRDTIDAGRGDDDIWAGAEANGDGDLDVLIFRAGDGADQVHGFDSGLDVLDLGGRGYSASETSTGTLLDFGNGDSILLHGVYDFI